MLLAQITVWAFALRRKGKRRLRRSSAYARDAGLQALGEYLQAMIERNKAPDHPLLSGVDTLDPNLIIGFLLCFGGFRAFSRDRRWAFFRQTVCDAHAKIDVVYLIVEYLARTVGQKEHVLEAAYRYAVKCSQDKSLLDDRAIKLDLEPIRIDAAKKSWQSYRSSAPIIFSVRRHFPSLFEHKTAESFIIELHRACLDRDKLLRVLGEAAFAARVIAEASTTFKGRAYTQIEPVVPDLPPLSEQEQALVKSIDRERRHGSDASPDYRPKIRKPSNR